MDFSSSEALIQNTFCSASYIRCSTVLHLDLPTLQSRIVQGSVPPGNAAAGSGSSEHILTGAKHQTDLLTPRLAFPAETREMICYSPLRSSLLLAPFSTKTLSHKALAYDPDVVPNKFWFLRKQQKSVSVCLYAKVIFSEMSAKVYRNRRNNKVP